MPNKRRHKDDSAKKAKFLGAKKWYCRCNKRSCQARVIRKMHPQDYKHERFRRCKHWPNCDGKLVVDYFRMDRDNRQKDYGEICYDDCFPYPHKIASKSCRKNPEYVIEYSLANRKHSPIKSDLDDKAPF